MGPLLRAPEAAAIAKVGVSTMYYLAATNQVPHIRYGRRAIRFPEDELRAWLRSKVQGGGNECGNLAAAS